MTGNTQRADTARVDRRYAIYLGDGLYVRSLARESGRLSIGRDRARRYTREAAIAALHVVRKAGRCAWLVPHAGRAGGAA